MEISGTLDDIGTRVSSITVNGPADMSRKVRVGDRILMVTYIVKRLKVTHS